MFGGLINAAEKEDKDILMKESMDDICEALEKEILKSDAADEVKQDMLIRLRKLCGTETNIMLVGATGCGKSSTINALFSCNRQEEYVEAAKVGSRADREVQDRQPDPLGHSGTWRWDGDRCAPQGSDHGVTAGSG